MSVQAINLLNRMGSWPERPSVALVLIALLTFGVYVNFLNNGFHYDDKPTIEENEAIRSLANIPSFFTSVQPFSSDKIFASPKHYRPVLLTTYAINYFWGGLDPKVYHLTNIFFHILLTFLIYLVIQSLVSNRIAAFLGGLLFGIHPLYTETLNYISARSSLLCTLLYVCSFYYFMRFRILQANQDWKGAAIRYALFLLTFVMAFLTKEIAITLPLMILIFDLYAFHTNSRKDIWAVAWPYVPGLAMAAAYIAFAHAKLFSLLWELLQGNGLRDLWTQLLTQAKVTSQYFLLFLWPVGLTPDHHVVEARSFANLATLASLGLIAVLITVIFLTARSPSKVGKTISLGMGWFLITSLPTILIPVNLLMQEHRAYLPCVGLIIASGGALAWIQAQLQSRTFTIFHEGYALRGSIFLAAFAFLILSGYSIQTVKRNMVWKDDLTLWSDAVSNSASGFRAHNNLGAAYEARGRLEDAIKSYERAIEIEPDHFITYYNLGLAYQKQGKLDLAITNFQKSLKINPIFPLAHHWLGIAYTALNEPFWAEKELREALRLDPAHWPSLSALGWLSLSMGNFGQAHEAFQTVLQAQPNSLVGHIGLATVYNRQHQFEEAIAEYDEVLKLDPENVEAYYNLGLIFYELEKMDKSISAYQKAISIAPKDPRLHTNLGNAYKRLGNTEAAINAYREAIRWNPTFPLAHYNMATTSEQVGRRPEALEHYGHFLDLAALNSKYEKMVEFAKDRQKKLVAINPKRRFK